MEPFVPLLQTAMWVLLLLVAAVVFRRDISALRRSLHQRLGAGAPVKLAWLELGQVQKEVEGLRHELDDMSTQVTTLFLSTMSPPMYGNLLKLESGSFGPFDATDGLKRELNHLRDLGYVEVDGVRTLPPHGPELSDHVRITPTGRDFVRLRRRLTGGGAA